MNLKFLPNPILGLAKEIEIPLRFCAEIRQFNQPLALCCLVRPRADSFCTAPGMGPILPGSP